MKGKTELVNPEEADLRQQILGLMEDRSVAALHEAVLAYRSAFPESSWGWLISVPTLLDLGLYKQARKAWRRARKLSGDEAEGMLCYWACTIDKEQGRLKRAQRWIERAIDVAPEQGSYWVTLGDILARRGKQGAARRAHQAAIDANTSNAASHASDASADDLASDDIASDIEEAHFNLALLLRAQRRYEDAMAQVSKALAIDPDYAEANALRQDLERVL